MNRLKRRRSRTSPRWLCAPKSLISFEQGHTEVIGTTTSDMRSTLPSASLDPTMRQVSSMSPAERLTGACFSMK